MKRIRVFVILALVVVLGGVGWFGLALHRTWSEHRNLMDAVKSGLLTGTAYSADDLFQADLRLAHSTGPFLKYPWRHDVRLYYIDKQSGRDFGQATREGYGKWHVKIP